LIDYRFTLPLSSNQSPNVQYIIWNKGIGANSAPPASKEEITRRIEVMRLLITVLSKTMYMPLGATKLNPWTMEITTKTEKKAVLGMLCSFLNTVSSYDPVGWATLPYNHLLFGDLMEPLASLCAQCLIALLDFTSDLNNQSKSSIALRVSGSSESMESLSNAELPASTSSAAVTNLFVFYFSKLHKPDDLEFLVEGITRLLKNPIDVFFGFDLGCSSVSSWFH
jgi:hypothetical protein